MSRDETQQFPLIVLAGSVLLKGLQISVLRLAIYMIKCNDDCGVKKLI